MSSNATPAEGVRPLRPREVGVPGVGGRVESDALVGRDEQLSTLLWAVSRGSAVVSIEGEAGVGKTRLVRELRGAPVVAGRRLLIGGCRQIESVPLGPVIEALRGVVDDLRGLPLGEVAGALRPWLPELSSVLPPAPDPLDDRDAERHRVFRGLTEILKALSPVVLVLEDLHWADLQTADFLTYLVADLPAELAVLLTFRGEEVSATVRALTARLPAATTRVHLVLAPLDVRGTGALAAAILDVDRISEEFAAYLWERTSGLPFAVEEVLELVRIRGQLERRGGTWTRRNLAELEVPRGIRDSTLERVARLPAAVQRVIEAAAVLQNPVRLPVLLAVADQPDVIDAAAEAIASGLLSEQGGLVGFRHSLATQAVYENLSGPRRLDLHGWAADVLRGHAMVPLGQVCYHLMGAGRLADWAVVAEAAADQAMQLADDAEATRLLGDLLRLAPLDTQHRGRIAVKLGWAAMETLHHKSIARLLSEVLELDLPKAVRGELRYLLAAALNAGGEDRPTQVQLLIEAVDELDERPALQARVMIGIGVGTSSLGFTEALVWLNRAVELVGEIDEPLIEVYVLGKAGGMLVDIGDPRWRLLVDRVRGIVRDSPRQRREVTAYYSLGVEACFAGHLAIAEQLLNPALEAPAIRDSRRLEIVLRSALAVLAYLQGRWEGLDEEVGVLLDELSDYVFMRLDVEATAGCLALARGAVDDARRQLDQAIDTAERLGVVQMLVLAVDAAVRAALFRGEVAGAVAYARRSLARLDAYGWAPVGRVLPSTVEALVAAGEVDEARELVERTAREVRDLDVPLGPAALRYARGVLDGSAEDFLAAAGLYAAVSAHYEAARANERAAQRLFAAGDVLAGTVLRKAIEAFDRLGADWDHGRAAGLARQYGVSPPTRHRGGRHGYGAALSPREREVAELAAVGRTNKDIAQELFLSAHTVARHMTSVLRKMGARSRTELAHRLVTGEQGKPESG